jgi:hypothetical protein
LLELTTFLVALVVGFFALEWLVGGRFERFDQVGATSGVEFLVVWSLYQSCAR